MVQYCYVTGQCMVDWWHPDLTAMKVIRSRPTGNYTQVPNEVLKHPIWTSGDKPTWAALVALIQLYRVADARFDGLEALAGAMGYEYNSLRKHFPIWTKSGLVRRDGSNFELYPFADGSELPEHVAEQATEQVDKGIAEEIAEQPKRESTGLSQKQRWAMIKEAWNEHKPSGYMQLDGSVNLPLLIAIETQTKRLKVDRDDYDAFIGAVLRGAKADAWWADKDFKATAVFGFGAELDDKKFENVEKLYKAGLKIAPRKAPKDLDDETALRLVREAWPNATYKRVVRKTFTTYEEAKDAAAGPGLVIGIKKGYCSKDDPKVRDQMNRIKLLGVNPAADPEWYDEEVLGLTYVDGNAFPSYWTDAETFPLS